MFNYLAQNNFIPRRKFTLAPKTMIYIWLKNSNNIHLNIISGNGVIDQGKYKKRASEIK